MPRPYVRARLSGPGDSRRRRRLDGHQRRHRATARPRATSGDIVAFLDSDAYPASEWPYYLALGFDRESVVGVGGPNECPVTDAARARQIVAAPGGPIHVLLSDDR